MITIPIILFFAAFFWDLITDYKKWLKEKAVAHAKEAWIRCAFLIPATVGFIILHPSNHWEAIPFTLVMEFFVFWALFDGLYNKLRGFNFWYTGTDDSDDAATDNFLQSIPLWLHIAIKIGGCLLGTWLYFK